MITSSVIKNSGIQFGTSGARGLVEQFTPEVCAAFSHAFIRSIQSGFSFDSVAVAIDNRPSSPVMAQAIIGAVESMGLTAIYYGVIPTPALAYTAMQDRMPCIMVTGSHIPFDRNGIKFYRPDGEITKDDEKVITSAEVEFDTPLLADLDPSIKAAENYVERYTTLFPKDFLEGKRVGIYEHSSAGRDLYQGLFESLGAHVISLDRTNDFVPIDTEAVAEKDKEKARNWSKMYELDFIFSTDGDGDRPLVADEAGEWLRGDILGLLCAEALNIEALALPVSCNTVIDTSNQFSKVLRTKIGSPFVIAEFAGLSREYNSVAGFEANGGFLLGSEVRINGKVLKALPTRDAVLPALMLLDHAKETSVEKLVKTLPSRFTHSDRLQNFDTQKSLSLLTEGYKQPDELLKKLGFLETQVVKCDHTDGLRLSLSDNTIFHLRPSGNAPELRCYAEASSENIAQGLVKKVLGNIQTI